MNRIKEIDNICKKYNINYYIINNDGSIDVNGNVNLKSKDLIILPVKFNIVNGFFDCGGNKLRTLKNGPVYVDGYFSCDYNKLTDLKYSPEEISSFFSCTNNNINTLKYLPQKVKMAYFLSNNFLTSLKGSPKVVYGNFHFTSNFLKTLKDGPERVYGDYYCGDNQLKSFENGPKFIQNELYIDRNYDIYSFVGIPCDIKNLFCFNTILYNVWKLFQDASKIELFNDMDIIREDDNGKPLIILDRLNEFLDMIGKSTVEKVEGYINI